MRFWNKKLNGWRAITGSDDRINMSSRSNPRAFYNCRDKAELYEWLSVCDCLAGDYVLFVRNTDDETLYIDNISLGTDSNNLFYVHNVTGNATGSTIIGSNPNLSSDNEPTGAFKGNGAVTGISSAFKSRPKRVAANTSGDLSIQGCIILSTGDAIAVQATQAARVEVAITGYYE